MSEPAWVKTARELLNTHEAPGSADNETILSWANAIASAYPEMRGYTKQYTHDSIAWCGWFQGYIFAVNGIRPPYDPDEDTSSFMWANAWQRWGTGVSTPQVGDVLCLNRHVTCYVGTEGNYYLGLGGNQSDSVNITKYPKSAIISIRRPPAPDKLPKAPTIPAPPMPASVSRFGQCLPITLNWEGGNDDDPSDPGGRTSRGILQSEWNSWRAEHPGQGLPSDVWQAPQDQIIAIYREKYWNFVQGDSLPPGVDLAVFDFRVNSGRGVHIVQRLVGVEEDGEVGPITLAAINALPADQLINEICDARLSYLKGLGTWATFGKGWSNRVRDVRARALAMVGTKPVTPTPAPTPEPTPMPTFDFAKFAHDLEEISAKLTEVSKALAKIQQQQLAQPELPKPLQPAPEPAPAPPFVAPEPPTVTPAAVVVKPAQAAVVVKPEPAITTATAIDVRTALVGIIGTVAAVATGIMGTPVGDGATTTGLLVPLLTVGASALGLPGAVVPMFTNMFSALGKGAVRWAASQQQETK